MRAVLPRLDGGIVVRTSRGTEFEAKLLHAGSDSVVFEVYGPEPVVEVGETLADVTLLRGRMAVCAGAAKVTALLSTGSSVIVTIAPQGRWVQDEFTSASPFGSLQDDADALVRRWREGQRVMPAYQIAVHNIRSFLAHLSEWVAPIDAALAAGDPLRRAEWSSHIAESIFAIVRPQLSGLFGAFEQAAVEVPIEQVPIHRAFAQREIHPFILCAPLVHRSFNKPLGYAGDYGMVNMLLRNAMEGPSVYAKVINAYFLRMDIAEGHRNRIEKLVDTLSRESRRSDVIAAGRPLRVLNIGCGPVDEIVRFIGRDELSFNCEFTLVDFNAETLAYARQKIEAAASDAGRRPVVRYVKRSVNDLLKDATRHGRIVGFGEQDLVYCAGLFDYLSDKVCERLLSCFHETAAPGGLIVATNVHPRHTAKATLSELAEWSLILRTEEQMADMAPESAGSVSSKTEAAGTNVFLEFRRVTTEAKTTQRNVSPRGTSRCVDSVTAAGSLPGV
jgi:extracellular factor (EF) 3-hydroxypalmitic acid methyl ester biosynthesis protein